MTDHQERIDTDRQKRVAKLPRWAQQYIGKLEADIKYYTERQYRADSGDTDTFISDYVSGDTGLPPGTAIEFIVEGGKVRCRVQGDVLEVRGSDSVVVIPRVSNSVRIEVRGLNAS